MAFVISRFQEGISLNPKEYALDENKELIKFDTELEAREFLLENGYDAGDINECVFIDDEDE